MNRPEPIATLDRALAGFIAELKIAEAEAGEFRKEHEATFTRMTELDRAVDLARRDRDNTEDAIRNLGYTDWAMSTDLAVIEAALEAALSADEVLAGFSLDYTLSEWGKARAASDDFDAASREYVAELVERVKAAEAAQREAGIIMGGIVRKRNEARRRAEAAEATIARIRALAEEHPGTAWNSGLNLRQALRDALGGTPTDATEGASSADDEQNRFSGDVTDFPPQCTETITLRDEEHRLVRCLMRAGHPGDHTDTFGTSWTAPPTDQRYEPPVVDHESGCCR